VGRSRKRSRSLTEPCSCAWCQDNAYQRAQASPQDPQAAARAAGPDDIVYWPIEELPPGCCRKAPHVTVGGAGEVARRS